jgi:hypothetical protein
VYRKPVPSFRGSKMNADVNYLMAVDRHDTAGLGRDVGIVYAVNSDALLALVPRTGDFVTMRVPYPMGFYTRNAHGRIDDAKAGWKGRGLWSSYMSYTVWHVEGDPGTTEPAEFAERNSWILCLLCVFRGESWVFFRASSACRCRRVSVIELVEEGVLLAVNAQNLYVKYSAPNPMFSEGGVSSMNAPVRNCVRMPPRVRCRSTAKASCRSG